MWKMLSRAQGNVLPVGSTLKGHRVGPAEVVNVAPAAPLESQKVSATPMTRK